MKRVTTGVVIALAIAGAVILAHLALIEVGREVVTLRTRDADGGWTQTRLWVVDHDGSPWLHSAGEDWVERFAGDPLVELERGGEIRRYRAHAAPGAHPDVDRLLREKYGIADRWVRFVAPCDEDTVPVRLDPLVPEAS